MFKSIKFFFGSIALILETIFKLLKFGNVDLFAWLNTRKDVRTELKTAVNMDKVTYILEQMEDIRDMDVPQPSKDLALAKLQSLLTAELTSVKQDSTPAE
jgi:hypothetical protein